MNNLIISDLDYTQIREGAPATRDNRTFSRKMGCCHDGMTPRQADIGGWHLHGDLHEAVLNHARQRAYDNGTSQKYESDLMDGSYPDPQTRPAYTDWHHERVEWLRKHHPDQVWST